MATSQAHATLPVSGFERWSNCTAAPRYEEQFPDEEASVYAAEGTLAHSACELYGRKLFKSMSTRKFNSELKKLQENELWNDEMLKTAEVYVNFLKEKANEYAAVPFVAFEVRVDLSDIIPEGFGTCDCIMIGGDTLHITDYKHGKGIPVSSIGNGQMRLYALGALKHYAMIYGDTIKRVCTAIVQPRITEDVTEEWLTVDDLKAWADTDARPKAQAAYFGFGTFCAGDWCRFCKGKAECRARAEYFAGFEAFKNHIPEGALSAEHAEAVDLLCGGDGPTTDTLTDTEVGDLLTRAAGLVQWYSDLKDYARTAILAGRIIPGWKVVAGKSNRAFVDADKALEIMRKEGYDDAVLFDHKQKTLAQLEKLTGEKRFAELMGDLITRPPGNPTLATESDPRENYKPVGPSEFAGVSNA